MRSSTSLCDGGNPRFVGSVIAMLRVIVPASYLWPVTHSGNRMACPRTSFVRYSQKSYLPFLTHPLPFYNRHIASPTSTLGVFFALCFLSLVIQRCRTGRGAEAKAFGPSLRCMYSRRRTRCIRSPAHASEHRFAERFYRDLRVVV